MVTTRYAMTRTTQPYLRGLEDSEVTSFVPAPRRYKQRGLKVGRWFIPLGKWRAA